MEIELYSHGCLIRNIDKAAKQQTLKYLEDDLTLKEFVSELTTNGRVTAEAVKKRFYGEDKEGIRIHRNCLPYFLRLMEGVGVKPTIKERDSYIPKSAKFKIRKSIVLRDYQEPLVAMLADSLSTRLLDLQVGKGKTLCALAAMERMGCRFAVMVAPKYFGLWKTAIENLYSGTVAIREISGGEALLEALNQPVKEDIILISNTTYRIYLKNYESGIDYKVAPDHFHKHLGIGVQINDEFQDDPGLSFRVDLYSDLKKMIYLSATPYTGNDYVTSMINIMAPSATHCELPEWHKHVNVTWVFYSDPMVKKNDYLRPYVGHYHHIRYEGSLLKNKKRKQAYFDNVARVINGVFVSTFEKGQKALILCSTKDFIRELTQFLKQRFSEITINLHLGGMDYTKIMDNDITVATPKSCGTGVDIPNLKETLLLVATGSEKDTVQIMGRTRVMKDWPDITPRLSIFVCDHIPHHQRYMNNMKEVLTDKASSLKFARLK